MGAFVCDVTCTSSPLEKSCMYEHSLKEAQRQIPRSKEGDREQPAPLENDFTKALCMGRLVEMSC